MNVGLEQVASKSAFFNLISHKNFGSWFFVLLLTHFVLLNYMKRIGKKPGDKESSCCINT